MGTRKQANWCRTGAAIACLALSVIALLLWARLKLITGIPRTAYAEPKQQATAPAHPAR